MTYTHPAGRDDPSSQLLEKEEYAAEEEEEAKISTTSNRDSLTNTFSNDTEARNVKGKKSAVGEKNILLY